MVARTDVVEEGGDELVSGTLGGLDDPPGRARFQTTKLTEVAQLVG